MDWYDAQKFLRTNGWAAWVRTPGQGFSWHIHMASLPPYKLRWVAPVGEYVSGQVDDYYARKNGLSDHSYDPTWHPENIKKTIFKYRTWVAFNAARKVVVRIQTNLKKARNKLKRLRKKQ